MWVPHDVRDLVVDFVRCWSEKTEIGAGRFIHWLRVRASKFYNWRERAVADLQNVAGNLFEALANGEAVERFERQHFEQQ